MNIKRRVGCVCNGNFISIEGHVSWSIYYSSEGARFYHKCDSSIDLLGKSTIEALNKSREVTADEGKIMFANEKRAERSKNRLEFELSTYNYKTETALYKNMMSCSISDDGEKIEISPSIKKSKGCYERTKTDGIKDILIASDSPPEIIGAALKFAFTRCRGKGVDVVTKALFPDGVPNSLEEYLESVNKDYKKWLISC